MSSKTRSAVMNTYARFAESMVKGEGMYLFDSDGRRYLDFYSGIAVNSLGHSHPHLVGAIQKQAAELLHISNLFHIPGQEKLARRLTVQSFADQVFFTNSGVEAMEGMIKLARRYHFVNGNPGRWRVITVEGAFHGRSLATIAAAGNPKYSEGFGPRVDGFDSVPFGNINETRNAITQETAAILVEPVLGEGGIRPVDKDYMQALRAAADEFGLLLILDEIQSGAGRTGKMWAHEWTAVKPDAIAVAKGLGGGFPVGAILATKEMSRGFAPGVHGTTFGGNPLAMAAANAVLDEMEKPDFLPSVIRQGKILHAGLEQLVKDNPGIFDFVRGRGLMLGLRCNKDMGVSSGDMIARLKANGLLTVGAADNIVRILPPLILQQTHVEEGLALLAKTARDWS